MKAESGLKSSKGSEGGDLSSRIKFKREQFSLSNPNTIKQQSKMTVAQHQFDQRLKRMYKFPASINQAKVHAKSASNGYRTAFTKKKDSGSIQNTLMCPCCQNFVNTISIPTCYSTFPRPKRTDEQIETGIQRAKAENGLLSDQVFQIQAGDALFFLFIKLVIALLAIRFVTIDAYNMYTNYLGGYCNQPAQVASTTICLTPLVDNFATPNKNTPTGQKYFIVADIMSIVFVIVAIIFFIYGRVKLYALYTILEGWDITEDDYTILVQDIPLIPYIGSDARVKDVNRQYQIFLKKQIEQKIRVWLNGFYNYDRNEPDADRTKLDQIFFDQVYEKKYKQFGRQSQLYADIVSNINLCYDLTQLQNLENFRQQLVNDFILSKGQQQAQEVGLFEEDQFDGLDYKGDLSPNEEEQYISYLPRQIEIINRHYVNTCERIAEAKTGNSSVDVAKPAVAVPPGQATSSNVDAMKISRFVRKAFVSLRYQHFKEYLLQRYQKDHNFMRVNGNTISLRLSAAKKPNDVYWKNMKISDDFRKKQLRNSYLLVVISLFISGIFIFGLNYVETLLKTNTTKKQPIYESVSSVVLPLLTFLINTALNWALLELNAYERHQTKTEELCSLIMKNVASKFFNTALVYALVYYFGPKVPLLSQNGLVYVIISLVTVNAGLNIFNQIVQPYYMYLDWCNKQIFQSAKDGKINLFQIQLNKVVEKPAFAYDQAYSYYVQMIYVLGFYGYLVPMAVPIVLVAFIIQYWIDKWNILKNFSSPVDLGYVLSDDIWRAFQLTLVFISVGHWVWSTHIHPQPTLLSLICNGIATLLSLAYCTIVIFYPQYMLQKIEDFFEDDIDQEPYERVSKHFSKTYQSENPATSFLETQEDLEQSKKINFIARQTTQTNQLRQFLQHNSKFIPENEDQLKLIWENNEDETILKYDAESVLSREGFSIFCL